MTKRKSIVERELVLWTALTFALSFASFIASTVFWINIPKPVFAIGVIACISVLLKTPGSIVDDNYLDCAFLMAFSVSLMSLWFLWVAIFI